MKERERNRKNEKQTNTQITKVIKLGGSCLDDATSMRKAVSLLKNEPTRIAVVVSALKGITDLLLEAYYSALGQSRDSSGIVASIKKRHEQIAIELVPHPLYCQLNSKFQALFDSLSGSLRNIFLNRETSPGLKAKILSLGERLSAYLLSAALEAAGVKSKVYETDRIGLIATEINGKVKVDLEKFEANFKKVTEEVEASDFIPIFTGFFGESEDGEVVLFGRNGSDYSAAVIARGFRAQCLELYKDVPGILSADPSLIPESKLIECLSRQEASAFGLYGAKIIHPFFWHPLEEISTKVLIKKFSSPDSPCTTIESEEINESIQGDNPRPQDNLQNNSPKNTCSIKGFCLKDKLILLKIKILSSSGLLTKLSELERILAEKYGQIIITLSQGDGLVFILSDVSAENFTDLSQTLEGRTIQIFSIEKYLALIAAIGRGISDKAGLSSQILRVLSQKNISPNLFFSFPKSPAIILILKSDEAQRALRALHSEFIVSKNFSQKIVPEAHLSVT